MDVNRAINFMKIYSDDFISQVFSNNIEIFNLETFLENIPKFNDMIQEEFLLFLIKYLIDNFIETESKRDKSVNDGKIEYTILNDLFNKLRKYYIGKTLIGEEEGGYSQVYKVKKRTSNEDRAIKVYNLDKIKKTFEQLHNRKCTDEDLKVYIDDFIQETENMKYM